LVVGAPGEDSAESGGEDDNSASNLGAAYVFTRSDGAWSQQAYLKESNIEGEALFSAPLDYSIASFAPRYGYKFGTSVAISDDTLVVGANRVVYVFSRNSSAWSQQAYLNASNPGTYDYFGSSVAISHDTLVVGAYGEDGSVSGGEGDNSFLDTGAAYVFTRNDGVWSQQTYLEASNAGAADSFGETVAISGDTLVIGAAKEDSSANGGESDNSLSNAGAVYVW
ncbi:MAG: FG-GAP repeat protein, partial [Candidatus Thiodiazotropha sp. (ex Lucinoma annulata)]|nr:FG-GAP repeat protein [Candidatus Thiodiazotropha sp. (ex Lucinoma annulata)]